MRKQKRDLKRWFKFLLVGVLFLCAVPVPINNFKIADPAQAGIKSKQQGKKKSGLIRGETNLIVDPTFSKFAQNENSGWLYGVLGSGSGYPILPLVAASNASYNITDTSGNNAVIGHVEQKDFAGTKGVSVKNNSPNTNSQTRVGQLISGLQPGKKYVFSVDVRTNAATSYVTYLTTMNNKGNISQNYDSIFYPSETSWTGLSANKWKTLSYTFTAQSTTLWFHIASKRAVPSIAMDLKDPALKELTPFANSAQGSLVDENGNYMSGKTISSQHNLITLNYSGKDIVSDVEVNGVTNSQDKVDIRPNSVIKIKNAGFYQGKPVTLSLTYRGEKEITFTKGIPLKFEIPNGVVGDKIRIEYGIEGIEGNAPVKLLLPVGKNRSPSLTTPSVFNIPAAGVDNIIAIKGNDKRFTENTTLDMVNGSYYIEMMQEGETNFNLIAASQGNAIETTATSDSINLNLQLLDKTVPIMIPLIYDPPVLQQTKNDQTFKAQLSLTQTVRKQNDQFYPEQLVVNANMGNLVKTKDQLQSLKVLDKNKQDVTSQVSFKSTVDGQLEISFPKALLKQLEDNELTVTGEFDLNTNSAKLIDAYKQDGYFHFPIQAKNNQREETTTGEAMVKMVPPEGIAVPQTVIRNSTTQSLNPASLVKDLHSILPGETVKVIGFQENKTFDTIGETTVSVVIRCEKTGVEGVIQVPITVIEGALSFEVPPVLPFEIAEAGNQVRLIPRQDSNWKITINNRVSKNWQVKAESTPVQDTNKHNYPNTLIFKKENGEELDLAAGQHIIATGTNQDSSPVVSWNKDKGILFRYEPTMKQDQYTSTLTLSLEDVPGK